MRQERHQLRMVVKMRLDELEMQRLLRVGEELKLEVRRVEVVKWLDRQVFL